ncbi:MULTISPECIES: bacteriocin immunity protein [Pseudomonas]|uniref:bacteriocin immunity protein n=1 Tax=Pseudomonas guariconensis TaxID=1288410 RepID=UPI002096BBAE|nr:MULTISPECIES: bacteriocin immunity protein [Pseudomonas]MCO7595088.1 bacteriocin immunity protein [Pseudomonas guariconensis]MCU7220864.1 bacteriocin immunity protein [Pseudomonas brassicacearum]
MTHKEKLSDYTEKEFLNLVHEIYKANENEPDHILSPLLIHFAKITEHPSGYDLLYRVDSKKNEPPRVSWRPQLLRR